MPEPVALGLDLGTTGVRAVAVTAAGELVAESARSYPLLTPKPGWTEQRPADWLGASLEALAELSGKVGGREVLALGLAGQMHGMVPLDAAGEPLRPAILWNDQRTAEAVGEMLARVPRETFVRRGGNPPVTGFFAPKLLWLRAAEPQHFERTRHALLPKDFLGFSLTGELASEPCDDSGTNLFHLESRTWDAEVLAGLELSPDLLPPVVASTAVMGHLTRHMAAQAHLPVGLPVVAGAGDNAAAAIGLGLGRHAPGLGSVSLGTSGVVFAPLDAATPDPEGRAHLFCHADGGYTLLGVTLSAAGSLQWLRNTLFPTLSFAELDALAQESPPGANGVTFRPYLSGERTPHLDPDLRASWTGMSLATTRADLVRAVLEGVAYSLRDALDVTQPLAPLTRALATGGGAESRLWLQMVADVLELPLTRPERNLGAAYGAALLALEGAGVVESAARSARPGEGVTLEPTPQDAYREGLAHYRERGVQGRRGAGS